MYYEQVRKATFLARPNRFIARVLLDGKEETAHVKNTGRCRELLLPGAAVYLQDFGERMGARKTRFDLIAVEKARPGEESLLINMDAQAPNRVFGEWMAAGLGAGVGLPRPELLRPETVWGNSRFDFYYEAPGCRGFVEVKGVTLEEDGVVRFPDAPTQRGIKHLEELVRARAEGYEACVFFVVQMAGAERFAPNDATHPAFGAALRHAAAAGVKVLAWDCAVAPDCLTLRRAVPVCLEETKNEV